FSEGANAIATPISSSKNPALSRRLLHLSLSSSSQQVKLDSPMASSSTAARELQKELEAKANDLSKLQKDISKNHQVRKKYTIQLGENELVLKELDLLNEDANVYKLIGPVLVKQDLAEANANVRKRIEYISAELKRLDSTLQDLEEKQNSKKETIFKLQQRIQLLQAGKAKA
ncbi:Prefoldin, partial [Cynara cardunculus var. scolymus]